MPSLTHYAILKPYKFRFVDILHQLLQLQLVYRHLCKFDHISIIFALVNSYFRNSINPIVPAGAFIPPLKGIQILLIICAIMFLTLLLLGLGVSYYCLRRRTIPVVRRLPMSMGSGYVSGASFFLTNILLTIYKLLFSDPKLRN